MRNFSVFREEWRPVSGYEGSYEVSNFGRIRSLDRTRRYRHGICRVRGRTLGLSFSNSGYLLVGTRKNGKAKKLNVHILVAEAFLGTRPAGSVVHHIDSDKLNNFAVNLTYISRKENLKLGAFSHGERHPSAKLRNQDVPKIRDLAKAGWRQHHIGQMFGVTGSTVWSLLNGKSWTHVA